LDIKRGKSDNNFIQGGGKSLKCTPCSDFTGGKDGRPSKKKGEGRALHRNSGHGELLPGKKKSLRFATPVGEGDFGKDAPLGDLRTLLGGGNIAQIFGKREPSSRGKGGEIEKSTIRRP